MLLASGLGIGGKSNLLPLKLLVDFVCGHLGGGKVRRKWFRVEVRTQFVNVTVHAGLEMYIIYIYIYIYMVIQHFSIHTLTPTHRTLA